MFIRKCFGSYTSASLVNVHADTTETGSLRTAKGMASSNNKLHSSSWSENSE